jgi:hypothetical protein
LRKNLPHHENNATDDRCGAGNSKLISGSQIKREGITEAEKELRDAEEELAKTDTYASPP